MKANNWRIEGQIEVGKEGTPHYQGMLITPQKPAFSTVKTVLPRAHIEKARQKDALAKYVHKEDTRVATCETAGVTIPTLFEYQATVASTPGLVDRIHKHYSEMAAVDSKYHVDDAALTVVDGVVAQHIEDGMVGIEFIGINPMWRSSWKKFWRSIIKRNGRSQSSQVNSETPPSSPCAQAPRNQDESSQSDSSSEC